MSATYAKGTVTVNGRTFPAYLREQDGRFSIVLDGKEIELRQTVGGFEEKK